ncbi:DUF2514 family protein [Pseudomonas piscis]|uniref:DUF2514 family protein n=1 Tax=Pseudomonas piscis TaxID=2614538 RepID=UPI0039A66A4E
MPARSRLGLSAISPSAASAAVTRAALVLAELFKRADERAGDLAAYADQSRGRGVTCEQAYDAIAGNL